MIPFKNKNQSMQDFLENPYVKQLMSQLTEEQKPEVMAMLNRVFAAGESMNMMVSAAMSSPAVRQKIDERIKSGESDK